MVISILCLNMICTRITFYKLSSFLIKINFILIKLKQQWNFNCLFQFRYFWGFFTFLFFFSSKKKNLKFKIPHFSFFQQSRIEKKNVAIGYIEKEKLEEGRGAGKEKRYFKATCFIPVNSFILSVTSRTFSSWGFDFFFFLSSMGGVIKDHFLNLYRIFFFCSFLSKEKVLLL